MEILADIYEAVVPAIAREHASLVLHIATEYQKNQEQKLGFSGFNVGSHDTAQPARQKTIIAAFASRL